MKLGKPKKRWVTRSHHHRTSTITAADTTATTAKMYPFSNLRPNSLWSMVLHHRSPHTILNTMTLQQPAWSRYTGQWLLLRLLRDMTISTISSISTILCLPLGAPFIVSPALTVLNSQLQRNRSITSIIPKLIRTLRASPTACISIHHDPSPLPRFSRRRTHPTILQLRSTTSKIQGMNLPFLS